MKLRFSLKGFLRRSLVPSVGAELVEFRDWVFLSVFGVLGSSGKEVRSMSLSWKQPSNAIAWVALKVGICSGRGRRREDVRQQASDGKKSFSVGQTCQMRFKKKLKATEKTTENK